MSLGAAGCDRPDATANLTATWELIAATDPDPMTAKARPCADFGATAVRIQVTPGDSYDFPCDSYNGETKSFKAGYYSVQVILFGTAGKVLDSMEFLQTYAYGPTKLGEPLRFKVR